MANGVTIEIQGLEQLRRQLGRFPATLEHEIDVEMRLAAQDFENRAQQAAPVDTGNLRRYITVSPIGKMNYEVVSAMNYSAYVEWGTITFVKVPAELSAYAAQFKGKGIRKSGGMPPRPFFFIQMPIISKQLNVSLNNAVRRALP